MKRVFIGIGVVIVLAAIVTASILSGDRKKRTAVYAAEVTRRDISQIVKCSGRINPRVKVNISAHVIGKIEKLHVAEGEHVGQGAPFLELEKESFIAIRDTARAQLAIERSRFRQAEIDLADAELKLRRARRLSGDGIASTEHLEGAVITHQSAELQVDRARESIRQAQANLEKATDDLDKTTLFAPIAGRVIELHAEEGEIVVSGTMNNAGSIIGVVADLSEILVEVDVDETEIVELELDQRANVYVDALPDLELSGRVIEIGSSGYERPQQPDVTFFKVEILLDEPVARLRPGMSARAEIGIRTHEGTLVIPIQAVVQRNPLPVESPDTDRVDSDVESGEDSKDDEIEVVFVYDEDGDEKGIARQVPVETGISDATDVEILTGLDEGQRVVTGPYRSLKKLADGDALKERSETGDEDGDDSADDEEGDDS